MGLLLDGEWRIGGYDTDSTGGRFEREASSFRRWVTRDGERDGFPAQSGRYHLYVSFACPWAHRALILRRLKGLDGHFKCNRRRIVDYEHLWPYLRDLYQVPGVAETVHFDHIRNHYYQSHEQLNPTRIVPVGPDIDFSAPHGRGALAG